MNLFTAIYFSFLRLRNNLDFAIRQRFHPSLKLVIRPASSTPNFLSEYSIENREKAGQEIQRLRDKYHFAPFETNHAAKEIRENYFYLDILDKALDSAQASLPASLTAADIGPSSWFYVQALYASLTWHGSPEPRTIHLTGYEVDAYRLYADFHTRKDHALGQMQGLAGVDYLDHGFTFQPETFYVITMFFPFVFEKDHLQWGLPGSLFDPAELMKSAWESLKSGGLLIIVNQGHKEHKAETRMLEQLNIPAASSFKMDPLLYSYPLTRYIITVKK